jgi:hypothetical protein
MITLNRHDLFGIFLASYLVNLFFFLLSLLFPIESPMDKAVITSGIIAVCTLCIISVSSNGKFKDVEGDRNLILRFGRLTVTHGSPKKALSQLALSLQELFDRQNVLNALRNLNESQTAELRKLDLEIPEAKDQLVQFVEIASRWGMEVPERWQWKHWILPGDRLEPAVTEASDSVTPATA